jgi:hypothetical protein
MKNASRALVRGISARRYTGFQNSNTSTPASGPRPSAVCTKTTVVGYSDSVAVYDALPGSGAPLNLELVDSARELELPCLDRPSLRVRVFSFPLEAMEVTGKSKTGEAGRKVLIARADARASQLAPIVAELRRGGITSWYGIAIALNKRGVPTATGRGIWEPAQVRRVMERAERRRPGSR